MHYEGVTNFKDGEVKKFRELFSGSDKIIVSLYYPDLGGWDRTMLSAKNVYLMVNEDEIVQVDDLDYWFSSKVTLRGEFSPNAGGTMIAHKVYIVPSEPDRT